MLISQIIPSSRSQAHQTFSQCAPGLKILIKSCTVAKFSNVFPITVLGYAKLEKEGCLEKRLSRFQFFEPLLNFI